jgi:hypothetical protein
VSAPLAAIAGAERPAWQIHEGSVLVGGVPRRLRLTRFDRGWLASVDTSSGPTLGFDHSPYLAAHRALEPLSVGIAESMTLVGPILG